VANSTSIHDPLQGRTRLWSGQKRSYTEDGGVGTQNPPETSRPDPFSGQGPDTAPRASKRRCRPLPTGQFSQADPRVDRDGTFHVPNSQRGRRSNFKRYRLSSNMTHAAPVEPRGGKRRQPRASHTTPLGAKAGGNDQTQTHSCIVPSCPITFPNLLDLSHHCSTGHSAAEVMVAQRRADGIATDSSREQALRTRARALSHLYITEGEAGPHLLNIGLILEPVPGKGHCLPLALIRQAPVEGAHTPALARTQVADYMKSMTKESYEQLLPSLAWNHRYDRAESYLNGHLDDNFAVYYCALAGATSLTVYMRCAGPACQCTHPDAARPGER
jgi:hypothetical protein